AEDGIRDFHVTGVQTCALPIYQKYLSLCPNAVDKEFVEKQIAFLEEEFRQYLLFQKEVVKSDLEYLKLHFEKIQNGQSVALAERSEERRVGKECRYRGRTHVDE